MCTWLHGVVIISFVSFEWSLALSHTMRSWSLFTPLLLVELTTVAPYLLAFSLRFWGDWIEFYARLLVLLDDFLSSLLSLHTYVMCCTGCLYLSGLSGSHTALL